MKKYKEVIKLLERTLMPQCSYSEVLNLNRRVLDFLKCQTCNGSGEKEIKPKPTIAEIEKLMDNGILVDIKPDGSTYVKCTDCMVFPVVSPEEFETKLAEKLVTAYDVHTHGGTGTVGIRRVFIELLQKELAVWRNEVTAEKAKLQSDIAWLAKKLKTE